jgi:hypothetical protein
VWISRSFDPTLTWADLDWIRERWSGPVIVKGVLDPEDARAALTAGADALVVSNHGGRQLDGAASSISALPGVVDAVGSALPVLLDGGVRSGLDVLRALTLGARACLIGRPWAFALAARGEAGVAALLERTRTELVTAMQLTGTTRIDHARRTETREPGASFGAGSRLHGAGAARSAVLRRDPGGQAARPGGDRGHDLVSSKHGDRVEASSARADRVNTSTSPPAWRTRVRRAPARGSITWPGALFSHASQAAMPSMAVWHDRPCSRQAAMTGPKRWGSFSEPSWAICARACGSPALRKRASRVAT